MYTHVHSLVPRTTTTSRTTYTPAVEDRPTGENEKKKKPALTYNTTSAGKRVRAYRRKDDFPPSAVSVPLYVTSPIPFAPSRPPRRPTSWILSSHTSRSRAEKRCEIKMAAAARPPLPALRRRPTSPPPSDGARVSADIDRARCRSSSTSSTGRRGCRPFEITTLPSTAAARASAPAAVASAGSRNSLNRPPLVHPIALIDHYRVPSYYITYIIYVCINILLYAPTRLRREHIFPDISPQSPARDSFIVY